MSIFKNLSVRSCCYCSSSIRVTGLLCAKCESILNTIKNPTVGNHNGLPFPVFYLFPWIPDQTDLLSHLLICLKNPGTPLFHRDFARAIAHERGFYKNVVFVPVPPTEEGVFDHAHYLCSEISAKYGEQPRQLLKWKAKLGKQREKGKKDRGNAEIVSVGGVRKVIKNQKVILVDDIVTTGSTALKAYEALGSPKDFELWCLACRQKGPLI